MSVLLPLLPAAIFELTDVSKLTGFETACIRLLSLFSSTFYLHLIEMLNSRKQEIHLSYIFTCVSYVTEIREVITVDGKGREKHRIHCVGKM
jgi:hypothetical protein